MTRPRVGVLVGYFDWFSGYQETALVKALEPLAEVEVIASDRVSPIFSDAHLERLGVERTYATGSSTERGVTVTRLPSQERRAMVWSRDVRRVLRERDFDLLVQVMPGQGLSAAGAFVPKSERRIVLYGDNSAMWSGLSGWKQRLKWVVFAATKGQLYRLVNRRSDVVFGYTPETLRRLAPFQKGCETALLPLAYDSRTYFYSEELRERGRAELGFQPHERVIMTAGKLVPYKRLEMLVDAFTEIADAQPEVRLLVVGDDGGDYSASLQRRVPEALRSRTTFLGFQDADGLNRLFNVADVGVWPALPAVTIQQAMGTGLAVCLPRNEWVGHLVRPGSGTYFGPGSPVPTLTAALEETLSTFDFGSPARRSRGDVNGWLAGEGIAQTALNDVAPFTV